MGYLKERVKHAIYFRHKRGFGVHSPFMFNLILNVIRDREKLYSYPEALEKANGWGRRERKVFRLLTRLVRCLKVRKVVCLGRGSERLAAYLSQTCPGISLLSDRSEDLEAADFIYVGRKSVAVLPEEFVSPKYVVIADIYKDAWNGRIWRKYRERATVSVDMMWNGLLLFDEKIQKGKYHLMI